MDYKYAKCGFKVPDEKQRLSAVGSLAGTPIKIKKTLQAIIPMFSPIPKPGPSDWLYEHDEDGQTYETYKSYPINWIKAPKNVIYIQPLEIEIHKDFINQLEIFCRAFFFGVEVKIKPTLDINKLEIKNRINDYTGKKQYHAGDILKKLEAKIPSDCYCLIGILMSDLYPREEWNFVFGMASLKNRTGVFSFARYDENFFTEKGGKTHPDIILYRSIKVMVHETGHMFGLKHCIYYSCIMNGSNHLNENKDKPMELCPVCVRKLQENIQFDFLKRYIALENACKSTKSEVFKDAGDFYERLVVNVKAGLGQHYQEQEK